MSGVGHAPHELPLTQWSSEQLADRLSLADTVDAVASTLAEQHRGGIEQPPRMSLGDGRLLVMAARSQRSGDAVVKTIRVNAHGDEGPAGVDGLVLWVDSRGRTSVARAEVLTILRTAAMVSLATDVLAPPQVDRLAILGAGAQAHRQVEAVARVRPLTEVAVWNRSRQRGIDLVDRLRDEWPGVRIDLAETADEAVRGSAVVCCATAAKDPLFQESSLEAEAHVNAIGSYRTDMRELPRELMGSARLVSVDDREGALAESGEIVDAVTAGVLDAGDLVSLAELIEHRPARSGRTVFKSVGMAAADFAVAGLLTDLT